MSPVRIGPAQLPVGVTALIPAAGSGRRLGGGTPKQFLPLAGVPVLARTLQLFEAEPLVDEVVVAAPPDDLERVLELARSHGCTKVTRVVAGGDERQHSVEAALRAVTTRPRVVCVHDAARPLLAPERLRAILAAAAEHRGLVMAVPVADTIKQAAPGGPHAAGGAGSDLPPVARTLERSGLWAAQTPQVFHADLLARAFDRARADGFIGTDDAALVEHLGEPVAIFPGSRENIKLTMPEDWALAEAILARRAALVGGAVP